LLDRLIQIAEVGLLERRGVLLLHVFSGGAFAGLAVGAHERGHDASVERSGLEEAAGIVDGCVELVEVDAELGEGLGAPGDAQRPGGGVVLEVDSGQRPGLSYRSWWRGRDLNPRPPGYELDSCVRLTIT